jgi:phage gp36-like protein
MAFLTVDELNTHLYAETVETVSREDATIMTAAVDAAIAEAKGYLALRYNIDRVFSATGKKRNALLLVFLKDIAVWHFVNLGNAATDMELRRLRYERAIDYLKGVMKGDIIADLPLRENDVDGLPGKNSPIGDIAFGSNPRRRQHF